MHSSYFELSFDGAAGGDRVSDSGSLVRHRADLCAKACCRSVCVTLVYSLTRILVNTQVASLVMQWTSLCRSQQEYWPHWFEGWCAQQQNAAHEFPACGA